MIGKRDTSEFLWGTFNPVLDPEAFFDATNGACTISPYWPDTIIDENSELLIASRTPTFPFTTEITGETGCLEADIDYVYETAEDGFWKRADIWVVDKSDVQRGAELYEQRTPEDMCDTIMTKCTGDYQQYDDVDDCVDYHTNLPSYKDIDPKQGCMTFYGETSTCHSFWLSWIEGDVRPEYYCPRVGKAVADVNGVTWCNFDDCDPAYYYETCYNAAVVGEGMAYLIWTQAGVDYDGRNADRLAFVRGDSEAGDRITDKQYEKMLPKLMEILELELLECDYQFDLIHDFHA